ncbi:MAG: peptidoglycan-binding protein [Deltaproteobacteria bacterium]|nr:peptidoglycan-binding protein [Deltaproteobacteria bacterium]
MVAPASTDVRRPRELPRSEALAQHIEGGNTLRRGADGPEVAEAQRLLEAHGFSVGPKGVDGKLGRDTRAALVDFQRSRGLSPDGVIGTETLRELRTPTTGVDRRSGADRGLQPAPGDRVPGSSGADFQQRARLEQQRRSEQRAEQRIEPRTEPAPTGSGAVELAPRSMSERQRWDHYAAIVRANGGEVCADGKPTVLGVRGMDVNGNRHASTNNRKYDDTFVVLTPDHRVLELRGATHAGQKTTSLVDHVGRINAGNYRAVSNGDHNGMPSFHVRTRSGSGSIPGVRDRNDDGNYSSTEIERSRQRGDALTGILFHVGFEGSPKSIGCQTLPPDAMRRFIDRVGGRGFSFTLVDA